MATHILLVVRLGLLVASLYGYIRLIGRRVRKEFVPGILFASLCSIMFFAGILNLLQETAWAICVLGVYLAIKSFVRKESVLDVFCLGTVFFVLSAAALLIFLYGMTLTDYDDFSHWGTVVKVMYTYDRFPNFSDSVIAFQSYPTGSASLLYFFIEVSGITSEWFQLWIQSIFTMSILVSLFAFARGWQGQLFAAGIAWILMLCNTGPINLLVDTLLPVVALGGACICFYYRQDEEKAVWLIPYLISLTAIKNSGILFAVFLLIFALYYLRRKEIKTWCKLAASPFATLLLWLRHVALVYSNGLTAKHSMSAESILNALEQKETNQMVEVLKAYLGELLSPENPALYLAMLALLLLAGWKMVHKENGVPVLVILAVLFYGIYAVGTLGMYLTTMPYKEAVQLAGFSRYHRSILIFCGGLLYIATAQLLSGFEGKGYVRAAICTVALLLSLQATFPGLWYNNPKYCGFIRTDFETLVVENNVQAQKRYYVVLDSEYASKYSGYLRYVIRYLLGSTQAQICSIDTYLSGEDNWEGYDYLIFFGEGQAEVYLSE